MRETVKVFKALSDETRLRTLNVLLERECCVCEIMQTLDISQSKASRSLSALCEAKLLKLRKEGLWSLYSVDREGMKDYFSQLVEVVKKALEENKEAALDKKRLKTASRVGTQCARNCNNNSSSFPAADIGVDAVLKQGTK